MRTRRNILPRSIPVLVNHLLRDVDDSNIVGIVKQRHGTYLVTMQSGWKYNLRVLPASSGSRLRRVAFAYRTLVEHGIPAPQVFASNAEPQPALLLEHMPGTHLDELLAQRPDLSPQLLPRVGTLLKQMHAITFAHTGLFAKDGPDPNRHTLYTDVPTFLRICGEKLEALIPRGILSVATYARLIDLVHTEAGRLLGDEVSRCSFVHGTFTQGDLLVQYIDGTWQVSGILGGEEAGAGDRWHDVLTFEQGQASWRNTLLAGYGEQPDWAAYRLRLLSHMLLAGEQYEAFFRRLNSTDLTPDFAWVSKELL